MNTECFVNVRVLIMYTYKYHASPPLLLHTADPLLLHLLIHFHRPTRWHTHLHELNRDQAPRALHAELYVPETTVVVIFR